MHLCSNNCSVRSVDFDDMFEVLRWRNHADIRKYMFRQDEISEEDHVKWFGAVLEQRMRRMVIVEDERIPLGAIIFDLIDQYGLIEWGFYAIPGSPKGSGTKIGNAGLEYCFRTLECRKLFGRCLSYNVASIRLHKKLGFLQEADLRLESYQAGKFHNVVRFGLLKSEWKVGNVRVN